MIAPDTVAAVKERTDIVALIGQNVRLQKRGRSYVGLCPFHKDSAPSFHVHRERGFFYCFGCRESGSAIDYVMKLEGLTFPEAVRSLAERCGVVVEENTSSAEQRAALEREQNRKRLHDASELAAAFFEQQLGEDGHPLAEQARAELARRGLPFDSPDETVQEALKAFRVGYAPYGWEGLARDLERRGGSLRAAEAVGLVAPRRSGRGHYDRFRHRLMFAVCDLSGRVVAFSGRALPEPTDHELAAARVESMSSGRSAGPDAAPAKYINSPESPVYTKGKVVFGLYQARHAIRQQDRAVLVEGNFDVLSLHARGLGTAVAPLGTALTEAQSKLIKRYTSTAILLFDADAAGAKAVRSSRSALADAGLMGKVGVLPAGTDPDDFVREQGIEALELVLGAARGLLDHLIDDALGESSFQGSSLEDKQRRLRAVAELLAAERDPTLRTMAKSYADRLSSQLVVSGKAPGDLRELERLIGRALQPEPERFGAEPVGPGSRSQPQDQAIGESLLGAVLDCPELLDDDEITAAMTELEGDMALGVAAVRRMWDPKKSLQAADLLDLLPPAIHAFAAGRLASPKFEEAGAARTELLENARKLRQRAWSRDRARLVEEISRAEATGDSSAQDELLLELARRSKRKLGLS